jgi:nucleoside phosphorylase
MSRLYLLIFLLGSLATAYAGNVGWFYALEEDRVEFEKESGPPLRTVNLAGGTVVREYRVGPHKVVAAKMGSGCVTTAITVARVTAVQPVDRLISTGPAGAVGDEAEVGAWYRVSEVAAWQQGRAGEGGRIFPAEGALRVHDWKSDEWPDGAWKDMPSTKLVSGEVFVASGEKRGELAREFEAELVEIMRSEFWLLAREHPPGF